MHSQGYELSWIWLPPGREVGRTISMQDALSIILLGVTLSCASKSWTYIVWKALAVIRKLEV
ncbi:MAG: hypothetical protein WAN42_09735, partial [Pseudolabrys sp.]